MISSGMHVSWSIFNGEFGSQVWWTNASIFEVVFVQIGFFVGSIVGGFNSGYFVDSLGRRKVIVSVCEAFMIMIHSVVREFFCYKQEVYKQSDGHIEVIFHLKKPMA